VKKQKEIMAFWVIVSIGLAAFFIPAVSADGDGGAVFTEASVDPGTINLSESTTVTLRAFTNVTTEKRDVDVVLVTDLSGSMAGSKLYAAKNALETFVDLAGDEMYTGLASFSNADAPYSAETMALYNSGNDGFNPYGDFYDSSKTNPVYYHWSSYANNGYSDAHIDANFTQNKAALKSTINSYAAKGGTNIAGGINAAKKMLDESGDPDHLQVIVVMSDGIATMAPIAPGSLDAYMPSDWVNDWSETGRIAAREAADVVKGQGITVYAIGFGSRADADTLVDVASSEDNYYYAPTNDQLAEIYSEISVEIEKIAGARAYHVLPDTVEYIEGSASIDPNIIGDNTLEWIIGDFAPEAPWNVTFEFDVLPQNPGHQPLNVMPDSKVIYTYGSAPGTVPFPAVFVEVKTPPVADFEWTPEEPKADEDATFTATASDPDGGDIVSYEWNFGDGSTASGETVTHAFDEWRDYTVTLTVTDDEGETASVNKTINVLSVPPVADFEWTPEEPKADEDAAFNASASCDPDGGSIISYVWNFGDGSMGSGETVTHAFAEHGDYEVTLNVTDDEGEPASVTKTVCVPGITITPPGGKVPYIGQQITIGIKFTNGVGKSANLTVDGECTIWSVESLSSNETTVIWTPMSSGNHTISAYLNGEEHDNTTVPVYIRKVE
jgi:PKD repeat protein